MVAECASILFLVHARHERRRRRSRPSALCCRLLGPWCPFLTAAAAPSLFVIIFNPRPRTTLPAAAAAFVVLSVGGGGGFCSFFTDQQGGGEKSSPEKEGIVVVVREGPSEPSRILSLERKMEKGKS